MAATLKASGKGGGRTNDEQTMIVAVAQNQRGELREADVTPALSTGGAHWVRATRRSGRAR